MPKKNAKKPLRVKATTGDNLNYFLHTGTDQQINFVFYLNGKIDEKIMRKTVRLSLDAEPILGCKYVKHWRRAYWERRDDLDELDYFELLETQKPKEAVKQFVLSEIDPAKDSLIKIRIFRKQKDILVIKSDHSVMDGGGFYDYLSLLCNIYNELLKDPHYSVTVNWPPKRELKQIFKHYSIFKKIKSLLQERGFRPTWSFPSIGHGKEKKNYILRTITPERFDRIRNYGKQHQATINDMLLTASFRALFKLQEKKPKKRMTLAVPTDLRALVPTKKADNVANLVASTFVNLKFDPHDSFDKNLQEISKQMKKKKEIYLGLGQMFVIHNLFRFNYKMTSWGWHRIQKGLRRKNKMHPIITNVGRIEATERHFGSVEIEDAHIITPINWAPSFSMGISSYKKKITLSVGFCEDSYTPATIEKFLDLLLAELPK
ncbi:MAG: hypothetical protein ACTSV6_05045 [Candidatus Heimdallarchaeota archaeon]